MYDSFRFRVIFLNSCSNVWPRPLEQLVYCWPNTRAKKLPWPLCYSQFQQTSPRPWSLQLAVSCITGGAGGASSPPARSMLVDRCLRAWGGGGGTPPALPPGPAVPPPRPTDRMSAPAKAATLPDAVASLVFVVARSPPAALVSTCVKLMASTRNLTYG